MRFPRIAADDTRESNHGLAKMRIPNRRKATLVEPLSCNFGYLLATFYLAQSAASGFFTDDSERSPGWAAGCRPSGRGESMAGAAIVGASERPRRRDPFGAHSGGIAYWLILPLILLETVFVFYPIVRGILVSVQGPAGGIDFSNYATMLGDPDFLWIMIRTLLFTVLIDVIVLLVGFGVALLMNWRFPGRGL